MICRDGEARGGGDVGSTSGLAGGDRASSGEDERIWPLSTLVAAVVTDRAEAIDVLAEFREQLYRCMTKRADALFELTDALLCTDGPVKTPVGSTQAPEHRRGHGAMYDALNAGR